MFSLVLLQRGRALEVHSSCPAEDVPSIAKPLFDTLAKLDLKGKTKKMFNYEATTDLIYTGNFATFQKQLNPYLIGHYKAAIPVLVVAALIIVLCVVFLIFCCCCCKPKHSQRPRWFSTLIWYVFIILYIFSLYFLVYGLIRYFKFHDDLPAIPQNVLAASNALNFSFHSQFISPINKLLYSEFPSSGASQFANVYGETGTVHLKNDKNELNKQIDAIPSSVTNEPDVKTYFDNITKLRDTITDELITYLENDKSKKPYTDTYKIILELTNLKNEKVQPVLAAIGRLSTESTNSAKYFDVKNSSFYLTLTLYGGVVALVVSLIVSAFQTCAFHSHNKLSRFCTVGGPIFGIFIAAFIGFFGIIMSVIGASIYDVCGKGTEFPTEYFNAYPLFKSEGYQNLSRDAFTNGSLSYYDAFNYSHYFSYNDIRNSANFDQYLADLEQVPTTTPAIVSTINELKNFPSINVADPETLTTLAQNAINFLKSKTTEECGTCKTAAEVIQKSINDVPFTEISKHCGDNGPTLIAFIAQEMGKNPNYVQKTYANSVSSIKEQIAKFSVASKNQNIDNVTLCPFAKTYTTMCYNGGGAFTYMAIYSFIYLVVFFFLLLGICLRRPKFADESDSGSNSDTSVDSSDYSDSSSSNRHRHRHDRL